MTMNNVEDAPQVTSREAPTPREPHSWVASKGEVVSAYPLRNPWRCPVTGCKHVQVNGGGKSIETHAKSHGKSVGWSCSKCGSEKFKSYLAVACHHGKCGGRVTPKEHEFSCESCNRAFATAQGLGQHIRHAHPELNMDLRRARDGGGKTARSWSEEEVTLLLAEFPRASRKGRVAQLASEWGRSENSVRKAYAWYSAEALSPAPTTDANYDAAARGDQSEPEENRGEEVPPPSSCPEQVREESTGRVEQVEPGRRRGRTGKTANSKTGNAAAPLMQALGLVTLRGEPSEVSKRGGKQESVRSPYLLRSADLGSRSEEVSSGGGFQTLDKWLRPTSERRPLRQETPEHGQEPKQCTDPPNQSPRSMTDGGCSAPDGLERGGEQEERRRGGSESSGTFCGSEMASGGNGDGLPKRGTPCNEDVTLGPSNRGQVGSAVPVDQSTVSPSATAPLRENTPEVVHALVESNPPAQLGGTTETPFSGGDVEAPGSPGTGSPGGGKAQDSDTTVRRGNLEDGDVQVAMPPCGQQRTDGPKSGGEDGEPESEPIPPALGVQRSEGREYRKPEKRRPTEFESMRGMVQWIDDIAMKRRAHLKEVWGLVRTALEAVMENPESTDAYTAVDSATAAVQKALEEQSTGAATARSNPSRPRPRQNEQRRVPVQRQRKHAMRESKKRKEKRQAYRTAQVLFEKDRKLLYQRVQTESLLQPMGKSTCPIPPDTIHAEYKEIFGLNENYQEGCLSHFAKPVVDPDNPAKTAKLNNFQLVSPADVLDAWRALKPKAAPGPDGVRLSEIRKLDPGGEAFAILYTVWHVSKHVPVGIKECRTILLPKGGDPGVLKNWRPITIGSWVLRVYSRIVARNLERGTTLHQQQRGFLAGTNGCFENLWLWQKVMKACKSRKGALGCALLDVAKAFDSVAHKHVLEALERLSVPPHWVEVVKDLYTGVTTRFELGSARTEPITFLRGVKQGDPLSSFLFNACMDPLICELEANGRGPEFKGPQSASPVRINCLAFADDMGLFGDSSQGLQGSLDIADRFYGVTGMAVNASKSQCFLLESKGKTWKLEPFQFTIGGESIPSLGLMDTAKYLGLRCGPYGVKRELVDTVRDAILKLGKAPLKGLQRVALLKEQLLPKVLFALTVSMTRRSQLSRLDKEIRAAVKKWVHLPASVTSALLYLKVRHGGMGLMCLEQLVPRMQAAQLRKLAGGKLREQALALGVNEDAARLTSVKTAAESEQYWLAAYTNCLWQGVGAESFSNSPCSNTEVDPCSTRLDHKTYCHLLKMRTSTTPVNALMHRIRGVNKECRNCHSQPETLAHVLGECEFGAKDFRIVRHNRVVQSLKKMADEAGYLTVLEPTVVLANPADTGQLERLRPDLLVIEEGRSMAKRVQIVDVTVRFEGVYDGKSTLEFAAGQKIAKYDRIRPEVARMFETDPRNVEVLPFVLGSRGAVPSASLTFLKQLVGGGNAARAKGIAKGLSRSVIRSSCVILGIHMAKTRSNSRPTKSNEHSRLKHRSPQHRGSAAVESLCQTSEDVGGCPEGAVV